jgi:hypothetical protein
MYTFTIKAYSTHLTNLRVILDKAKVWQAEHKVSDETMLGARLALDQFPFASQVRMACNFARNGGAALCGIESPVYEDSEKTISDLQERIDKVVLFLKTSCAEDMVKDDLETRLIPLSYVPGKGLTAKHYVEDFAHPNFYFHYTTAYSILRHCGVQVGKSDYVTGIELKDLV